MPLIIVPYPNLFIVRNAKIDSSDRPTIAAFQFPQPLVGDIEIPSYRNGKKSTRKIVPGRAQSSNTIMANLSYA